MNPVKRQRAVILTRVSTEDQAGEGKTSLGEQARLCREFIDSKGWEFTGEVYEDAGVSGTVKNRPALTRALRDAAASKYDVLVVLNLTRLSRKLAISANVVDELAHYGVGVASVQESMIDTSTPAGRLMFAQFSAFAEYDRESILLKTAAGQRALARAGKLPGGEPPYGWKRVGTLDRNGMPIKGASQVVPDEDERATLRLVYDLLVRRRMSAYQVADWLNDAGYKPRHADRWNADVIRRTWRNPTLTTAEVVWGMPKASEAGRQRRHKARVNYDGTPKYGEPILINLGDPVFTAAQHKSLVRALDRRATGGTAKAPVSRLLTGRVYSTEGHPMYAVNLPREAWEGAYRCSKRRQSAGDERCECAQLRARPIEDTVWAAVVGLLSDPARLEAAAREYLALPEDGSDAEADQQALSGVQAEVDKFERALSRAERGVLFADTPEDERRQKAMVEELRRDLTAARQRLEGYVALVSSVEARGQALRDVAALAERAKGRLHSLSDEERAEVVRILQVSVVVGGPIVAGEAQSLAITGVVDPRLWAGGAGTDSSSASATPAYRDAQSAPGVAPWPPSPSPASS